MAQVVVPLFGVRDTVVLAISTPLDGDNYYSQMLEATRPDGSRLFNVLEVKLLCDECQAAGALSCPHKTEMPPWKTGERQARTLRKNNARAHADPRARARRGRARRSW